MRRIALVPVYNEEATVLTVLDQAQALADMVVVVDDGSRDRSAAILAGWQGEAAGRHTLTHLRNRGMAGALYTGFRFLLGELEAGRLSPDDVVITLDADGQHSPAQIPEGLRHLADHGLDVVLGRRNLTGYPLLKQWGNRWLSRWASWLSHTPYHDVECGYRWMRLRVLAAIFPLLSGRRYGCAQELAILTGRLGWRVDNTLPVTVSYYRKGARIRDGFTNAWCGLSAWHRARQWQRSHRLHPRISEPPARPHT
jgi:glycosyltransferase involved in cell wall biosynthesis